MAAGLNGHKAWFNSPFLFEMLVTIQECESFFWYIHDSVTSFPSYLPFICIITSVIVLFLPLLSIKHYTTYLHISVENRNFSWSLVTKGGKIVPSERNERPIHDLYYTCKKGCIIR